MAGAGGNKRDEQFAVAGTRRRQIMTEAERPGLRLVPQPHPDAERESGQTGEEARLLGAYNLYNG